MALKFSSLSGSAINDFTISIGATGYTNISLGRDFPAGTYTCVSTLSDSTMDIYLVASDGSAAGYINTATSTSSITASKAFNTVVVYGATTNDTLTFSFEYIFSPTQVTSNFSAAPRLISSSNSSLPNQDNNTLLTGENFATDVTVTFTGSDNVARSAKSITRNSSTSLTVTRPDNMPPEYSPYTITAANPGIASPTTTNLHKLSNAATSGSAPVWVTSSPLNSAAINAAFSQTLQATDADGGSSVTYSVVSGSLADGLSLNSNSGVLSGTPTTAGAFSFTVRATDSGGNYVDRAFTQGVPKASGGTVYSSGGYFYHVFTANGTFTPSQSISGGEVLVIAGGAGGGGSGGGGAGGLQGFSSQAFNSAQNYSITIGAGGAKGSANASNWNRGTNGQNSQFGSLGASIGGGAGAGANNSSALTGGSGGGNMLLNTPTAGTPGQGNAGGYSTNGGDGRTSGGGGGAGAVGGNATQACCGGTTWTYAPGGNGSSAYSDWGAATSTGQNISGTYWYAGGGGGGSDDTMSRVGNNFGGNGGGGNGGGYGGGSGSNAAAQNGTSNTGGGGGGAGERTLGPGNGGSGLVIVRYQ